MEAEKIVLPSGNTASLAATHTLTPVNDSQIKLVPVPSPVAKVVVFLIGGAGDKKRFLGSGPNNNIQPAKPYLEKFAFDNIKPEQQKNFDVEYLGYYEVFGEDNIEKNVISAIPNKKTVIYIVGHSLGGWNGAHLSKILSDRGYDVRILVTLDPVGESNTLEFSSKIYSTTPAPIAKKWINIVAQPSSSNFTDFVAWMGEKWKITSGPDINTSVDTNHAEAITLLTAKLNNSNSAYQIITQSIYEVLSK
ncbi:MAG: alpha/beta hydrolase [Pseudomonas gingeri]